MFKRVDDHNELVDDIGFNYPIDHHPMTLLTEEDYFGYNGKERVNVHCHRDLMIPEVLAPTKTSATTPHCWRNRVFVHENQIALFNDMRLALMDKLEVLTQSTPEQSSVDFSQTQVAQPLEFALQKLQFLDVIGMHPRASMTSARNALPPK